MRLHTSCAFFAVALGKGKTFGRANHSPFFLKDANELRIERN